MSDVVISGSGLWHPDEFVTNEELVEAYNAWAERFNQQHAEKIAAGQIEELQLSSPEFILKASGIRQRYTYRREGILDVDRMRPVLEERSSDQLSHQAEMAVRSARDAMESAGKLASDVDTVIVSCAYTQRAYPAIAIEVQEELGIQGYGFDMLVACSAATFALQRAYDAIAAGTSQCVLVINPELVTPQVNFKDRDGHFIFGDVSTAVILERAENCSAAHSYEIIGTRAMTSYSSNVRSNFGHLSHATDADPFGPDKLFCQNGRKVFKEVCPMTVDHLQQQMQAVGLGVEDVRRWWLHQANINTVSYTHLTLPTNREV